MHDRFELGYTFSSTQAASLVKSVPFGHISEADVAAMKSTTKDTKTKAHPQIPDLHPRANWFPNAAGTPTTTKLTSTHAHTAKTCVCD